MDETIQHLEERNRFLVKRNEHLIVVLKDGKATNVRCLREIGKLRGELDGQKSNCRILAIETELHAQENGLLREKLGELGEEWPTEVVHERASPGEVDEALPWKDVKRYQRDALLSQKAQIEKRLEDLDVEAFDSSD